MRTPTKRTVPSYRSGRRRRRWTSTEAVPCRCRSCSGPDDPSAPAPRRETGPEWRI